MKANNIINSLATKGITAELHTVNKNGHDLGGISIANESQFNPIFYLNNLPDDEQEAVQFILNSLSSLSTPKINLSALFNYESIKNQLYLCIRPLIPSDIATITSSYLDLELYVSIHLDDDHSTKVTYALLNRWDISKTELFEQATANMVGQYICNDIFSTIAGITESEDDLHIDPSEPMHIITTRNTVHGASAIYNTDLLLKIADILGDDLYILPSSIHELIVVPASMSDIDELNFMVRTVNAEQVAPEEVLSDHAYFFNRSTTKITW